MYGNHDHVLFDKIVQEVMTWLKSQLLSILVEKMEGSGAHSPEPAHTARSHTQKL